MMLFQNAVKVTAIIIFCLTLSVGCGISKSWRLARGGFESIEKASHDHATEDIPNSTVMLASHSEEKDTVSPEKSERPEQPNENHATINPLNPIETLTDLELLAASNNPTLRRLRQEASADWAKVGYVGKLPDPTISSQFYTPPMNFEPDRQLAEFQLMQMIPWLARLDAQTQRSCLEASATENMYRAERLRIIGDLRAAWYRLYVLAKQIEATEADQKQLESLVKTANARVATGNAPLGDVLMATLELSALQDQIISYRQQVVSTSAELNRLVGRDTRIPIAAPIEIAPRFPEWNHDSLKQLALQSQPEMNAARMQTAATRWGIEVARLQRRPDLTFGLGWVVMDAPSAITPDAGRDAFTLGASASIPLYRRKYDAILAEAKREHAATHASEEEIALRLDAMLRDLWEQAKANQQSIELYEKSILPQAKQTLAANQKSLVNNSVAFERVVRDSRTLLNLELGYHRALGQLATTLARIRQTVGVDLVEADSHE
jgi:outer membrane protein, heavy metal efflux system